MLDAFTASDFGCIDTADVYSRFIPGNQGGESETMLGKWMNARGNRDRVILATKAGMDMGEDREGLSKIYLCTAVEETLGACAELIRLGNVRVIGASNYSAERLDDAQTLSDRLGLPAYQGLQPLCKLIDRAACEGALPPLEILDPAIAQERCQRALIARSTSR